MHFLVELLFAFSGVLLEVVLDVFGYDWHWRPVRPDAQRRSHVLSALLCFAICATIGFGAIWLMWWLGR